MGIDKPVKICAASEDVRKRIHASSEQLLFLSGWANLESSRSWPEGDIIVHFSSTRKRTKRLICEKNLTKQKRCTTVLDIVFSSRIAQSWLLPFKCATVQELVATNPGTHGNR